MRNDGGEEDGWLGGDGVCCLPGESAGAGEDLDAGEERSSLPRLGVLSNFTVQEICFMDSYTGVNGRRSKGERGPRITHDEEKEEGLRTCIRFHFMAATSSSPSAPELFPALLA
jgi:hypothetical protein